VTTAALSRWRRLLLLPPILLGAGVLALQMRTAGAPEPAEHVERAVAVPIATVERRTVIPRAVGFGVVQPSRTLTATAETAGRVVERHPDLERGRLLAAGTIIARLDEADLAIAQARVEAELAQLAAEVARIQVRRENLLRSKDIEQRAVDLAAVDLERQQSLLRRGSSSRTAVDQAETAYLTRLDRMQTIESTLAEIDPELAVRAAERRVLQAQLEQVVLDLERTEVRLPFAARVADVAVEAGQFVAKGQTLAAFDAIDHVEIDAQFALAQLRPLIAVGTETIAADPVLWRELPTRLGLTATVRLRERGVDATWPARFDRPSDRVDPQTRMLGLIVIVDDPYGLAIPGVRPPLTKNMHVEVLVEGAAQPNRLVVPLAALREEPDVTSVFVVDDEDRLRRRTVEIAARFGEVAVVNAGVEAGERVVVGPLAPAIEGMKLMPVPLLAEGAATQLSEVRP
jgi:membrane fusion protein, multidrug efflux system